MIQPTLLWAAAVDSENESTSAMKLKLSGRLLLSLSQGFKDISDHEEQKGESYFSIPDFVLNITGEAPIRQISFNQFKLENIKLGLATALKLNDAEMNGTNLRLDKVYAYVQAPRVGQVQIGATEGPAHALHYTAPALAGGNGVDSPDLVNLPFHQHPLYFNSLIFARDSTKANLSFHANKLAYYSPRLGGFQIGVAYTPDASWQFAASRSSPFTTLPPKKREGDTLEKIFVDTFNTNQAFGSARSIAEAVIQYKKNLTSRLTWGADIFYAHAFAVTSAPSDHSSSVRLIDHAKPKEYGAGTSLTYEFSKESAKTIKKSLTFSGGIYKSQDIAPTTHSKVLAGADVMAWSGGMVYEVGAWSVGAAYLQAYGKLDMSQERAIPADGQPKIYHLKNKTFQVGGAYALERGIKLGLEVSRFESSRDGFLPRDNDLVPTTSHKLEGYAASLHLAIDF